MTRRAWRLALPYDPVPPLVAANVQPVAFFARRDLLGKKDKAVESLWQLPEALRLVKRQQPNGSWKYPGGNPRIRSAENYNQLETYRNLGFLVEMFGLTKKHPAVRKAADFLLRFQTREGDIRGILGNQYAPYYTAAMAELFIKAGYQDDMRITKIFTWLNSIRQNDGGWAIPLRTRDRKLDIISMQAATLQPDKTKPSSYLITGVVLRAYAAHPSYCRSPEAAAAGQILLQGLFKKDAYPDRAGVEYWTRFTFPFWFTDAISAMDTLSRLGVPKDDTQVQKALQWFTAHQSKDGLWHLKALKNLAYNNDLWLSLSICRTLKRLG